MLIYQSLQPLTNGETPMTRDEFYKEVTKIKESLVPVSKKSVCLGYDKVELTCSDEELETATDVRVDFGNYPALWIDLLMRFPKLKSLLFNDCYSQPDNGSGWEGLSKLQKLESLTIRDCVLLTNDALEAISELSSLRILQIIANRMDDGLDFSVLGRLKNLHCLEIEAGSQLWIEDLTFIQELPNLEVLSLDGNEHLDLSKLAIPETVKYIEVPSYAVKELRERVGTKCHVVGGYQHYGKDKYRFMRPEVRKALEEKDMQEAKRLASLKRRIATVKSAMEHLMSEPLIPELGKVRVAQMNAHLLELEKSLQSKD